MKKTFIFAAIAAFAIFSCSRKEITEETVVPEDQPKAETRAGVSRYQKGRAVVTFDDNMLSLIEEDLKEGKLATKSSSLNSAMKALGVTSYHRVFPDAGEYEERTRREGMHRFYMVTFDQETQVTKALDEFEAVPGVLKAEGVLKAKRRAAVNDTHYSKQWHLKNSGGASYLKAGADINVEEVWKNYTTGNENVIVSVVDGGVALNHTDLADNAIAAGSNGSKNFVKNNYNIEVDDHGTHVAGTIAAITNNGKGVAGVAGGDYANGVKGCKVMSCEIFNDDEYDDNNGSDETISNAIKWGADHGALISQNSWGYYADVDDNGYISNKEYNDLKNLVVPSILTAAIEYFNKYAGCDNAGNQKAGSMMKGGVVIFAAGNENIDIDPICMQCDVVAVGAFGPTGKKASYSNYGSWVDIAGPGGDSDINYSSSSTIYSLAPSNKYAYMEGTSMACPHISGVAALIVSKFGGQGFTREALINRLIAGADDTYFGASSTIGPKVDALGSMKLGGENHAPTIAVDASAPTSFKSWETVKIALTVTDEDGDKCTVSASNASGAESILEEKGAFWLVINALNAEPGTFTTTLTATDTFGATGTVDFAYTIQPNQAPVVVKPFANIISGAVGQIFNFDITAYFNDPDGEPLTYKFNLNDNQIAHCNVSNNTLYVTSLDFGSTEIEVSAKDARGLTATSKFILLVRDGDSNGIDAYPNPVINNLYIRTGENEESTEVRLVSETGSVVYNKTSVFSAFNPLHIDMSACAPGVYKLTVKFGGNTYKKTITKR